MGYISSISYYVTTIIILTFMDNFKLTMQQQDKHQQTAQSIQGKIFLILLFINKKKIKLTCLNYIIKKC